MRNITRRMLALLICLALVFGTISFAAGEEKTGSKDCIGMTTDIFCYTRDWRTDGISGRATKVS